VGSNGSILVVCTGNVCRSPYLERRLVQELMGTSIEVSSAGTRGLVGCDMDPTSKALLERAGAETGGFTGRRLEAAAVERADLVLTAAREHRTAAARLHPAALNRVMTLRDFADLVTGLTLEDVERDGGEGSWVRRVTRAATMRRGLVAASQDPDVVDPIGEGPAVFERMAAQVDDALRPIVAILRLAPVPGF
jgi:protein-tyrosine phosphatase